jgi:hypothetical protein
MTEELHKLEKSFILDEDAQDEDIKALISSVQKFCKVDKNGFVVIESSAIKKKNVVDKILLVLTARYVANKLFLILKKESTINATVTIDELEDILKEKRTILIARLKDLKDAKKITSESRGSYKITAYSIKSFLQSLEGE